MEPFGDSFDSYDPAIPARLGLRWQNIKLSGGGSIFVSPDAARNGPAGLRIQPTGGFAISQSPFIRKTLFPDDPTTLVFGVAFRYSAAQQFSNYPIIQWLDAGTIQGGVRLWPDGTLDVVRGMSTQISAERTGAALLAANFYHIKGKIVIADGAGGSADIWINRQHVYSLSGIDTSAGSNPIWNCLQLGCADGYPTFGFGINTNNDYDDLYCLDEDWGFFDLIAFRGRAEDGNGANTGYTPLSGVDHGAMVSENYEDGDNTYNYADTVGPIDTYDMEDMPTTATIAFVQSTEVCRKTDAGDRLGRNIIRLGVTNYPGPEYAPNQTYAYMDTSRRNSPATGIAWTDTEVNAHQSGQEITL